MKIAAWVAALSLVLVAAGTAAAAEDPPPEPTPSATENATAPPPQRARAIEEIIVTAQKKEQSIQDVPISITALGGDFLKDAGVGNIHEVAEYAPNVRFLTNAGGTHVFIRGFGTPFSLTAFDPSVGLVLDELSIVKQIHMSDPMYDLERFEVLRGPQGTLFGKNTPAGLFNVTTASPTEDYRGYVIGRVGGLGVHRVEAAVGGPLGPLGNIARFRLAAVSLQEAEDLRNTFPGVGEPPTRQRAGRVKLELRPLDDLEILFIGSRAVTDSSYVFHVQNYNDSPETIRFVRQYDPKFEDDPFNHQNSYDFKGQGVHRTTDLVQANIRYAPGDLGWLRDPELVAVLGKTGFDQDVAIEVDFSPADVLRLDRAGNNFPYDQRSVEMRASGVLPGPFGLGQIDVLIGGQLFDAHMFSKEPLIAGKNFDEYLLSPPGFEAVTGQPAPGGIGFTDLNQAAVALGLPPPVSADVFNGDGAIFYFDQDTTSQALFGRSAWRLFDRWEVSFGGRLTFEKKDAHIRNVCLSPGFVCAAFGVEQFDLEKRRSETDFSPKVTLQYSPFDALTLFATRAQGFKSGGFNNLSFTARELEVDSEKAVSWEVGAKGNLFDHALSYGATLFWMDVDNLQLQNAVGAVVTVRNAGSARSRGLELDFQWLTPWQPLSVRGAGALTDAEFTHFPNAPAVAGSGMESQDLSGRPLPYVPNRQLTVTPELRFPFSLPALFARLEAQPLALVTAFDVLYRSRSYLDTDLDRKTLQGDYVKLNARVAVNTADDALSLGVGVDNVTNADILEYATDSLVYPRGFVAIQEFQRNFAFQARYNW